MAGGAQSTVGQTAWVVARIPGPGRPGEITIRIRGGTETLIAYADREISAGTSVVVIATRGPLAVAVTPLLG